MLRPMTDILIALLAALNKSQHVDSDNKICIDAEAALSELSGNSSDVEMVFFRDTVVKYYELQKRVAVHDLAMLADSWATEAQDQVAIQLAALDKFRKGKEPVSE